MFIPEHPRVKFQNYIYKLGLQSVIHDNNTTTVPLVYIREILWGTHVLVGDLVEDLHLFDTFASRLFARRGIGIGIRGDDSGFLVIFLSAITWINKTLL